jgi:hypothetical protein
MEQAFTSHNATTFPAAVASKPLLRKATAFTCALASHDQSALASGESVRRVMSVWAVPGGSAPRSHAGGGWMIPLSLPPVRRGRVGSTSGGRLLRRPWLTAAQRSTGRLAGERKQPFWVFSLFPGKRFKICSLMQGAQGGRRQKPDDCGGREGRVERGRRKSMRLICCRAMCMSVVNN